MAGKPNNLPVPFNIVQQPQLLIEHSIDGEVVPQRPTDGYINATRLCHQAGKQFGHYHSNAQSAILNSHRFIL